MDHADVVARMLIMNQVAKPCEYQALVNYYENRGFFLRFDLTEYTERNRAVLIKKKINQKEIVEQERFQDNE